MSQGEFSSRLLRLKMRKQFFDPNPINFGLLTLRNDHPIRKSSLEQEQHRVVLVEFGRTAKRQMHRV